MGSGDVLAQWQSSDGSRAGLEGSDRHTCFFFVQEFIDLEMDAYRNNVIRVGASDHC